MPTKGTPGVKIRIDPELWARYEAACTALGYGTRSDDLRRRVEAVVAEYDKALRHAA